MASKSTTITTKVMSAIMVTSITVLLFTCAAFITYEFVSFRSTMARSLETRADILAANATAAVAFRNELDARELLASLRKDPHIVDACLYDKDGRVFATYPETAPPASFPAAPPRQGYAFESSHLVIFQPVVQEDRWLGTLYVRSDLLAINERYRLYAILVLSILGGSILLAFALSNSLQKRISKPILDLAAVVRQISERREYSARAEKRSDDELGFLTDAFNDMLAQIQQRDGSLRDSEARMKAILDSALDGVITMDHDGRISAFNPAAERLFGHARSTAVGAVLADLIIPPTLRERHSSGVARYLATMQSTVLDKRLELTAMRSDGFEFPAEVTITRISQEGPPTFTGFIRDITERKRAEKEIRELNDQLEQRVIERTAELEASNRELEAFSSAVSHDLRAPLRSIDGFSKALLDDGREILDPQCQGHLTRIRAASQRMGLLIDDLLNLSRLSRTEMRRETVDLTSLARQITAELKQTQLDRDVIVTIEDGLIVEGDTHLLRVALENLLGNAWKYTSKHPTARIELVRANTGAEHVYLVRDDGAGFDMAHAALLFRPFQRLHRQTEFEGTGVGLATVQRIIHRHGGRLWAEGTVDAGAAFYFTLWDREPA